MKKIIRNITPPLYSSRTGKTCLLPLPSHSALLQYQQQKKPISYSYNFRKILDSIDDKSKLLIRKLDEYKYEFKNIFFNSWDDAEYKNNYLRSKSDQLAEARSATDLINIRDFEPLFEKDLFLFFVFKNHLLVKYLEIVKNRDLIDEYGILLPENCKNDLKSIELTYPKVETIQSIDILNMSFSYVDGYMKIIMDIEMYFYCNEGSYYNTVFKIEKHFTQMKSKENNNTQQEYTNEMELLEQMITGWRIKLIPPLLIKIE